jgi:hypothetical protein
MVWLLGTARDGWDGSVAAAARYAWRLYGVDFIPLQRTGISPSFNIYLNIFLGIYLYLIIKKIRLFVGPSVFAPVSDGNYSLMPPLSEFHRTGSFACFVTRARANNGLHPSATMPHSHSPTEHPHPGGPVAIASIPAFCP